MEELKQLNMGEELNMEDVLEIELKEAREEQVRANKRVIELEKKELYLFIGKSKWCNRNKVDKNIKFNYHNIDDDGDKGGYLWNVYDFTFGVDDIHVEIGVKEINEPGSSYIGGIIQEIIKSIDKKVKIYKNAKYIGLKDLSEDCKVAVNAIINDQPDFL